MNALTQPIIWAALAAAVALHIAAALIKNKTVSLAAAITNLCLHIALVIGLLYLRAAPEELFFALLLSSAAGLFSTGCRRKGDKDNGI